MPPRPSHHTPQERFQNPWPGSREHRATGLWQWAWDRARQGRLFAAPRGTPPASATAAITYPRSAPDSCRITWIGHSSFLLQIDGLNILTDPVFGERASPLSFMGPKRLVPPGIALDALPPIDIVLQSHDHYDHLCDATVRAIAIHSPDATWCCPLGVGRQLRARGVLHLVELDWHQSAPTGSSHGGSHGSSHGGSQVCCVPARHFAGRTMTGRNATLWCGWVLETAHHRIYFVGDTGDHPDFGEIAKHHGPFDAVLMPIGAYDPRWFMAPIHVNPEEAVAAHTAIAAQQAFLPVMVGMHWGTFVLTDEPVDEPPTRTRAAWQATGFPEQNLWIMQPGETRDLGR
ncbi:MAG: MBL fold metallo-hydrolase [Gemmatimonadetes bacterium]|nr:MBL fold metallo-hydrolase [Gemmatimonadota bacterium]